MGTRNLTAVYAGGEYKVAQYGQWDGYPEGAGMTVLGFARSIAAPEARTAFTEKVSKCRWITEKEIAIINDKIGRGELKNWPKVYPELSRDTGADILRLVNENQGCLALQDSIDFAADSLFCEYAWVIDLDAGTFEGYEGWNRDKPLTEEDRFFFLNEKAVKDHRGEQYYPVKLVAKWSLDALPTDEDFLAAFKTEEDDME